MSMLCGIHRRAPGPIAGLDAMLATLPGAETAVSAAWTEGAAGLGWRGDPDLRADRPERMPRAEARSGLVVTASVRLDDRAALCDALGIPGPQGGELPDSALLLRAYERWGRECPRHLLGDYAFAVWDARRRTLFLARDHIGTRPLLYNLDAERIVFASTVGAVLAAPEVSDALDEPAIAALLHRRPRMLGQHTCYRAVRRLPPGHTLEVAGSSSRIERWWRPEDAPEVPIRGDDALAEAFLELYERAVEERIRGVRRVGVHLSGGLDSSSVAALAARVRRRAGQPPPPAFAWQPPPDGAPETLEHELIEAVSAAAGLETFYCPPDAAGMLDYLRRDGTRDLDIHPNEPPVQRAAARQGVRVLLSGWGGDEGISFNGRKYDAELLCAGRLVALWRLMRQRSRRPLAAILIRVALPIAWPGAAGVVPTLREGRRTAPRTFIHADFARRVRPLPEPSLPRAGARRYQRALLQLGHLAERMDGWAATGARHGVEYAYPLLDRRLVEFALGLPPEHYRRGATSRWLMRHALATLLPAGVCRQVKEADPARFGAFWNAIGGSLPAVRKILAARSEPPARSAFLDMPRLTAWLESERPLAGTPSDATPNTLRFLDF